MSDDEPTDRSRVRARADLDQAIGYASGCAYCRGLGLTGAVIQHETESCERLALDDPLYALELREGSSLRRLGVQLGDAQPREHFPPSAGDRGFPCVVPRELLPRVARLRRALDRDREQSFVRLLTARPPWHHGLPSRRALRRALLRQAAINVAVTAAVCVGWLAAGMWRAWH